MTLRPARRTRMRLTLIMLALLVPAVVAAGRGDKDKDKDKAAGADGTITVEGDVTLPSPEIEAPAPRYLGFIERIANPLSALRPFDPRPECFVYLEGQAPAEASKPGSKSIEWRLESETFTPVIKPFLIGSQIHIKNVGKATQALYSEPDGALDGTDAVASGGTRPIKISKALAAVAFRSQDSPHLEGRAVGLPTRYFSSLKLNRTTNIYTFSIEGVPAGKWTLKVWYQDGWLPADQVIEVAPKMARIKVELPKVLQPKAK